MAKLPANNPAAHGEHLHSGNHTKKEHRASIPVPHEGR
ncbi:hypothetical protein COLO4_34047 [Corchorus olitorius]|uniref:Uncharacterized protein n=1 Tax=Corchorus olitorius TaxID=93759 RepID=A0A1R3GP39_9ROSI|nr:hypothetical protein COLO4_34047 [Corchorus olitorius]